MKHGNYNFLFIIVFAVIYSAFVFLVDYSFEKYAEAIGLTFFFFALLIGFLIAKQNRRHHEISEMVAEKDGFLSSLYRISCMIPEIQKEVGFIIYNHYKKIAESGDWAHHCLAPSTTLVDLTKAFSKINEERHQQFSRSPAFYRSNEIIWDSLHELEIMKKKLLSLYNRRLSPIHWALVFSLVIPLIALFNFVPAPDEMFVDVLRIIFGTVVFMAVILLKQLNDLSFLGKSLAESSAEDMMKIIEEKHPKH